MKRVLGRSYLVRPGVVGTMRGFAKSTGLAGRKLACFLVVDGTPFPLATTGEMVDADTLTAEVRQELKLEGVDFVDVRFVEASFVRAFPTEAW